MAEIEDMNNPVNDRQPQSHGCIKGARNNPAHKGVDDILNGIPPVGTARPEFPVLIRLSCRLKIGLFDFGFRKAEEVYAQSRDLIWSLGFHDSQLKLDYVAAGEGKRFSEKVTGFIEGINGSQNRA